MSIDKNKNNNEEYFDLIGGFTTYAWSNVKNDYKLIVEASEIWMPTSYLISILNLVNKHIKSKKYIFDGTIPCLKFLIKEKILDLDSIKSDKIIPNELYSLLKKYSKKNIDDIFEDIDNGMMLKKLYLEHPKHFFKIASFLPNLIKYKLKNNLPKTNTELKSLFGLNKDSEEEIIMNSDRWSPQAMRCKIVKIGLMLNNKQIFFSKDSTEIIKVFQTLNENDILQCNEKKLTIINAIWVSYSNQPWNIKKTLSMQELLVYDGIQINIEGTDLHTLYYNFFYPLVKKIALKHYKNFEDKHPSHFPIKYAVINLLHKANDYVKPEYRHKTLRFDGFTNKIFEYIFYDKDKRLYLQKWFVDYFSEELDKRIIFIKYCEQLNIGRLPWNKSKIAYLPILESFRFITKNNLPFIPEIISFYKYDNKKKLPVHYQDEIIKPIVFNIQKTYVLKEDKVLLKNVKEKLMLLVLAILLPKRKKIGKSILSHKKNIDNFYFDEITSIITDTTMQTILRYDETRNSSFFGYIDYMLRLNVKTSLRKNTDNISQIYYEDLESHQQDKILAEPEKISKIVENKDLIKQIKEKMKALPPKQREAIEKSYYNNEQLNTAERKNKSRAMKKIKDSLEK